jgi:23S rRNA pseudouridine1911/1915/1917 synthase
MPPQKISVPREAAGERLDKFLSAQVPGLSVERARALIEKGHVLIRGKKWRSSSAGPGRAPRLAPR